MKQRESVKIIVSGELVEIFLAEDEKIVFWDYVRNLQASLIRNCGSNLREELIEKYTTYAILSAINLYNRSNDVFINPRKRLDESINQTE